MNDVVLRIIASVVSTCLFCCLSVKLLGAMQQSGYKNGVFLRWFRKKENMFFNRLAVLALCLALSTAIVSLCFSFLGTKAALLLSAIPMFGLLLLFIWSDSKYALKVRTKPTGRLLRLFAVYFLFTACTSYLYIAILRFLAVWNGSAIYGLIAYVPFAVMPILLPALLLLSNAVTAPFEEYRNRKFIKRAGQVLDETKIIRIAVVGSYGKTSVKNILKTLLLEKYKVVSTPESYNTPIGIAKTVVSPEFSDKEIFIAEMGARKAGDISELCTLVKPDYVMFTGVCEQHLETFGSIENVWGEKSKALVAVTKKAVCGEGLKAYVERDFPDSEKIVFADTDIVQDVEFQATKTLFTLSYQGESVRVETALLGSSAVENILLAATLADELGLSAEALANGIKSLQPIPHRLQLLESGGAFILDDGYNTNPRGAKEALTALGRFDGRKCVVTPGIVECGVLEEEINAELGKALAELAPEKVILVGDTLVGAVKLGYLAAGGDEGRLTVAKTLADAQALLTEWIGVGDAVLFLNDLPDVY